MNDWKPTHRLTWNGRNIDVMECDGALYTRDEWNACERADWEMTDGSPHFQGGIPIGTLTIAPLNRDPAI